MKTAHYFTSSRRKVFENLSWTRKVLLSVFVLIGVISCNNAEIPNTKTGYACEGSTIYLSCEDQPAEPPSDSTNLPVINVVSAVFGRYSIIICNANGTTNWSTRCSADGSTERVRSMCGGKRSCSVAVSSTTFPVDPCPNTLKYLEVNYECVSKEKQDKPISTQAVVQQESSTSAVTFPPNVVKNSKKFSKDHCEETVANGVRWEETRKGGTRYMRCPNNDEGYMEWQCMAEDPPRWHYYGPDTSRCGMGGGSSPSHSNFHNDFGNVDAPMVSEAANKGLSASNNYCAAQRSGLVVWPRTARGTVARQACPKGASGEMTWLCDAETVQWKPASGADSTDCISVWLLNIASASKHIGVDNALPVAQQLANGASQQGLTYARDVEKVVSHLAALQNIADVAVEKNLLTAANLGNLSDALVRASSSILDERNSRAWRLVDSAEKRASLATHMLETLELHASMLAKRGTENVLEKTISRNILMGSGRWNVELVKGVLRFQPESERSETWRFVQDRIELSAESLLNARVKPQTSNLVSLSFLAYNNIGEYLGTKISDSRSSENASSYFLNSRVIAGIVEGRIAQRVELKEPIQITLQHLQTSPQRNVGKAVCVWWNYKPHVSKNRLVKQNGMAPSMSAFRQRYDGSWSREGCSVVESTNDYTVCSCDHLTNFAVLFDVHGVFTDPTINIHSQVLATLTVIGCAISIFCLVLSLLIFNTLKLDSERMTVHKHLAFCLLTAQIIFLTGIDKTHLIPGCSIFAAIMHYFFLATFTWAALEGVQIYLKLIQVFERRFCGDQRRRCYYAAGYGIPLVIVIIMLAIDWRNYGSDSYCWLRSDNYAILSFVVPAAIVMCVNFILFAMAIVVIYKHASAQQRHAVAAKINKETERSRRVKKWIAAAAAYSSLMCLTWIFGLMYFNTDTVAFAYLFVILNSFQGLFIFVFHCLRDEKIREKASQMLNRLQTGSTTPTNGWNDTVCWPVCASNAQSPSYSSSMASACAAALDSGKRSALATQQGPNSWYQCASDKLESHHTASIYGGSMWNNQLAEISTTPRPVTTLAAVAASIANGNTMGHPPACGCVNRDRDSGVSCPSSSNRESPPQSGGVYGPPGVMPTTKQQRAAHRASCLMLQQNPANRANNDCCSGAGSVYRDAAFYSDEHIYQEIHYNASQRAVETASTDGGCCHSDDNESNTLSSDEDLSPTQTDNKNPKKKRQRTRKKRPSQNNTASQLLPCHEHQVLSPQQSIYQPYSSCSCSSEASAARSLVPQVNPRPNAASNPSSHLQHLRTRPLQRQQSSSEQAETPQHHTLAPSHHSKYRYMMEAQQHATLQHVPACFVGPNQRGSEPQSNNAPVPPPVNSSANNQGPPHYCYPSCYANTLPHQNPDIPTSAAPHFALPNPYHHHHLLQQRSSYLTEANAATARMSNFNPNRFSQALAHHHLSNSTTQLSAVAPGTGLSFSEC